MQELVYKKGNNVVCDSLMISKIFHKRHDHIIRIIKEIREKCELDGLNLFKEEVYEHEQNYQLYPKYVMGFYGFTLLAMNFHENDSTEKKLKFINAFSKNNVRKAFT